MHDEFKHPSKPVKYLPQVPDESIKIDQSHNLQSLTAISITNPRTECNIEKKEKKFPQ